MKYIVIGLAALLAILHQDFWWWDSKDVIFGFLPIGLAWHVGISIGAGLLGLLAVTTCWPKELDEDERAGPQASPPGGEGRTASGRGEV